MSGTPEQPIAHEFPQNKPEAEYDTRPWGRTRPLSVQLPTERTDGAVTMAVMQFDPRTASRIGDISETWNLTDLRSQRAAYQKELAAIDEKIAYAEEAIAEYAIVAEEQRLERERLKVEADAAAAAARLAAEEAQRLANEAMDAANANPQEAKRLREEAPDLSPLAEKAVVTDPVK